MKTKMIDGVKYLKLEETHPEENSRASEALGMLHLWTLITGEDALRDTTVGNRQLR
ncbi:hypothetical protein [Octadecabacter sp. SW4]|uniref:hypothetical protein n=1 Tax=Octadecabacter sp. SW4 TaxID=2602067 RepID=UPI00155AF2BA|nr:hypothetical protein [Octadecabacter sp. SW4]